MVASNSGYYDIVYAVTDNAVYRSGDGGDNWTAKTDFGRLPVSSVAVNGSNLYAVSKDYAAAGAYDGSNWISATVATGFSGEHVLYHPGGTILVSGTVSQRPVVYKSLNSGSSYTQLTVNAGSTQSSTNVFKGCVNDPQTTSRLFVYGLDGTTNLYRTNDFVNNSFDVSKSIGSAQGTYRVNDLLIDPNSVSGGYAQTLYAAMDGIGVYKSTNAGIDWSAANGGLSLGSVLSLVYKSGRIYAAGSNGLYLTDNGGTNWTRVNTNALTKVIMRPGFANDYLHVAVICSTSTKIYYTNDGGTTWFNGTNSSQTNINALTPVTGAPIKVYEGTDWGIYSLELPPSTPSLSSPADGATDQALNFTASWNTLTGASSYHYMLANNSGFNNPTFNDQTSSGTSFQNSNLVGYSEYWWKVAGINIVGEGSYSTARKCTTLQTVVLSSGLGPRAGPGSYYVLLTWENHTNYSHYSIYRSMNGTTWTDIADRTTGDISYVDYDVTRCQYQCGGYVFYYKVVYGNSTPATTLASNTVSVQSNLEEKVAILEKPKITSLFNNYPNPFNPVTTLDYELASPGYVRMIVYNSIGQEVQKLVDENKNEGRYSIKWNAGNAASGLYFVRMNVTDQFGKQVYQNLKKLMLIK